MTFYVESAFNSSKATFIARTSEGSTSPVAGADDGVLVVRHQRKRRKGLLELPPHDGTFQLV